MGPALQLCDILNKLISQSHLWKQLAQNIFCNGSQVEDKVEIVLTLQ